MVWSLGTLGCGAPLVGPSMLLVRRGGISTAISGWTAPFLASGEREPKGNVENNLIGQSIDWPQMVATITEKAWFLQTIFQGLIFHINIQFISGAIGCFQLFRGSHLLSFMTAKAEEALYLEAREPSKAWSEVMLDSTYIPARVSIYLQLSNIDTWSRTRLW